ncbi:TPA: DUF2971 domain-containing protein [Photobacterium damselae]
MKSEKLKLYKYLPDSEGSLKVLLDGTLKFSSYDEFNDPFDCIVDYDVKSSIEYIKSRPELFKAAGDQNNLSPAKRLQMKNVMLKAIEKSLISGKLNNDISSKWGICCLSSICDNILMWSHYADNHRGFIVEFSTEQQKQGMVNNPEYYLASWPIKYSKEMPHRSLSTRDFDGVQEQFLTKSLDWEYENEYRCINHIKGAGVYKFDTSMITAVVVGVKMSEERALEIEKIVDELSLKIGKKIIFKRASMVKGKYELNVL